MTMQLLLHVGRHKTGSSSFQMACSAGAVSLARFGIVYPEAARIGHQHLALPASLLQGHPALPAELAALPLEHWLAALTQEARQGSGRLLLLSSEVFCELARRRPQACTDLLAALAERFALSVVQVVRDPHDYGISAVKHQLRHDGLGGVSPLSWYARCQQKHALLDRYWVNCGLRLTTLPYNRRDGVRDLLSTALRELGQERQLDRMQRRLAGLLDVRKRYNSDTLEAGVYGLYVLYLVHQRWQQQPALGFAAFYTGLQEASLHPLPPLAEDEFAQLACGFAAVQPEAGAADEAQAAWAYVQGTAAYAVLCDRLEPLLSRDGHSLHPRELPRSVCAPGEGSGQSAAASGGFPHEP